MIIIIVVINHATEKYNGFNSPIRNTLKCNINWKWYQQQKNHQNITLVKTNLGNNEHTEVIKNMKRQKTFFFTGSRYIILPNQKTKRLLVLGGIFGFANNTTLWEVS